MIEIDYKAKYEELKEYLIKFKPYCDSCKHEDNEDVCDYCDRQSFQWAFN